MESPAHQTKRLKLGFLAIASAILIAFLPSLSHIPRSDLLCYLIQAGPHDDLPTLITRFYSFPRTIEYGGGRTRADASPKGDNFLFRPLMYTVLGFEKWAFGCSFVPWQLTGVIIHLVGLWFLLSLLLKIRASPFAPLSVLFFGVLFISHEMVIWTNIHAYALAFTLTFAALDHAYAHASEGQTHAWRLWTLGACLTLACFAYELTVLTGIFLAAFLTFVHPGTATRNHSPDARPCTPPLNKAWNACLLLPWVLYTLADRLDRLVHEGVSPGLAMLARLNPFQILDNAVSILTKLFYAGLCPQLEDVRFAGDRQVWHPCWGWDGLPNAIELLPVVLLLVALTFCVLRSLLRTSSAEQNQAVRLPLAFLVMVTGLLGTITLLIIGGRGIGYLQMSLYYAYPLWALGVVILYTLGHVITLRRLLPAPTRTQKSVWMALLIFISVANAWCIYTTDSVIARRCQPQREFLERCRRFVALHENDPQFSFGFRTPSAADRIVPGLYREGDPMDRVYRLSEIIFRKYLRSENPKVWVRDDGRNLVEVP